MPLSDWMSVGESAVNQGDYLDRMARVHNVVDVAVVGHSSCCIVTWSERREVDSVAVVVVPAVVGGDDVAVAVNASKGSAVSDGHCTVVEDVSAAGQKNRCWRMDALGAASMPLAPLHNTQIQVRKLIATNVVKINNT